MVKPLFRFNASLLAAAVSLCSVMLMGCSAGDGLQNAREAPLGVGSGAGSIALSSGAYDVPETLEEHVARRVRGNSVSAASPIVIGTIGEVAEAGFLQPHHIRSPEEIDQELAWIAEESGIDIEATFGPMVTPSATEIIERADPMIVEDNLYGGLPTDVSYTTFVVHIERVLLDDDSNLREAETLLLREITGDGSPPFSKKGDRYLLMLDREPDGAYGYFGLDNGYRLVPDRVTDFRGRPPRLAADVDPESFVARVAEAIQAGFKRATDIANAPQPTRTPRPRVVGELEIVGQIGGGQSKHVNPIAEHDGGLILGLGPRLASVDLSDPAAPRVAGLSEMLPRFVGSIAVEGHLAFLSLSDKGVAIVDLDGQDDLSVIGRAEPVGEVAGVAVHAPYLYVTAQLDSGGGRFTVFDYGDPARPQQVGGVDLPSECTGIAVVGTVAGLACPYFGLQLIDVVEADHPRLAGSIPARHGPRDIGLVDGHFVVRLDDGLSFIDASDMSAPEVIGRVELPVTSIETAGDTVFVSDSGGRKITIVDAQSATAPRIVGTAQTAGRPIDAVISGDHAYAVYDPEGTRTTTYVGAIDVSDLASPREVGGLEAMSRLQIMAARGSIVFAGKNGGVGPSRLHAIDAADPVSPIRLGSLDDTLSELWGIAVDGDHIYAADGSSGLRIIDASNPRRLVEVAQLTLGDDQALDVAGAGGYAYVVTSQTRARGKHGHLFIVDVTRPAHPAVVGSMTIEDKSWAVAVDGNSVFLEGKPGELHVVDVTDRTRPKVVGKMPLKGSPQDLEVWDHHLYVWAGSIRVVDVRDPREPHALSVVEPPAGMWGMAVGDDRLYFTVRGSHQAYQGGVHAYDIAEPSEPRELGYIETPGEPEGVAAGAGYAYVADSDSGMVVVRVPSP